MPVRRPTTLPWLLLACGLLAACGATGNDHPDTGGHAAVAQAAAPAPVPDRAPDPAPASPLTDITGLNAHAGIRTDCQVDGDCAVVDVGNCCGSYPMCVRAGSQVDPAAVQVECAKRDMAGICGFPVIDACVCSAGRCQAMQRGTGPVQ